MSPYTFIDDDGVTQEVPVYQVRLALDASLTHWCKLRHAARAEWVANGVAPDSSHCPLCALFESCVGKSIPASIRCAKCEACPTKCSAAPYPDAWNAWKYYVQLGVDFWRETWERCADKQITELERCLQELFDEEGKDEPE